MSRRERSAMWTLALAVVVLTGVVFGYVFVPFVQDQWAGYQADQQRNEMKAFAQKAMALGLVADEQAMNAAMAEKPEPPSSGSPFAEVANAADAELADGNTITNTLVWGDAGPAPQTAAEASSVFGVSTEFLTPQYRVAGDPLVIGWVIGDPSYKTPFLANLVDGVCIDYTTSTGSITGETDWNVSYAPVDWSRALLAGDGTIAGYKATVWWSICDKGNDGEVVEVAKVAAPAELVAPVEDTTAPTAESVDAPAADSVKCPKFAKMDTVAGDDGSPYCKFDNGSSPVTDNVPTGFKAEYWDGTNVQNAVAGDTITTATATFRPQ